MSQLSLLTELTSKPWPEEIVESLQGHMTAIESDQGRLYCVRDWVYVVSGSTSQNRNNPFNDLKRALTKRGEWNRIYETFIDSPNPQANSRKTAFADDVGLYEVTIRMDDRSEAVRQVKSQMARSLAFQDWARRHPDQASDFFAQLRANAKPPAQDKPRDYYRLLNEGFTPIEADQLLRERAKLKALFREATETWREHGAFGVDFPDWSTYGVGLSKARPRRRSNASWGYLIRRGITTVHWISCSIRFWRLWLAAFMTGGNHRASRNWLAIFGILNRR